MKHLLLVRHAKSDWSDGSLADFDRPLNTRGKHDAPRMARLLARGGLTPTLLYSSPARRAYDTARLFADEFGIPENDISTDQSLYEASTSEILSAIRELPDDHDVVAVFSHNPGLTSATSRFAEEYVANVPTCGVAHVVAEVSSWGAFSETRAALRELYVPKEKLDAYLSA